MCHICVTNSICRLLSRAVCVIVLEVRSVCSNINMPRNCVNYSDAFCYICGEVTFKSRRRSFTPLIKKCYEHYFGCKVRDQEKSMAPHFCVTCARRLAVLTKFHALCHSPFLWFRGRPRTVFQSSTSAWPVSRCNSKVQTHGSIHKFTICDEVSTSQFGLNCAKASNNHDAKWQWVKWWRCGLNWKQYGLWSNICRSNIFQWTTPADSSGP